MRRREFIAGIGLTAAWSLGARAQSSIPAIGFVNNSTPRGNEELQAAFRRGVSETGFIEGQNVMIEYRWAEGHPDRLPALVADLMRRGVSVIAATSTPAALAAKAATATIPIVFETASDPIKLGLARDMQDASRALGLQIHVLNASTEDEINAAFATLSELQLGALSVGTGELFRRQREQLALLSARYGVPTFYQYREYAAAGGLISYGTSLTDAYRLAGVYTGRVLKGEKPADLPVMRPTKFELVINLKTAKALGLTIPPGVLAIADEVIE